MAINVSLFAERLHRPVGILPLVVFRVGFGVLMFLSTVRFVLNGWVNDFYIAPVFHFTYLGFDWVKPLPAVGMYAVFFALIALSLCIAFGLFYRLSISAFFILFTYVELLDKAYYLNHYYFISLVSFLLIFLPLHRKWSLDARRRPSIRTSTVPALNLYAIRLQLCLVYLFAGIAKLNSDWLFRAMPLSIWLPANSDFPLIGSLFDQDWFAYLMSWLGAAYDLTIPFFLLWKKTRPFAFLAVIGFHMMTAALFNIGMFPWIMMVSSLIFLEERDYHAIVGRFRPALEYPKPRALGSANARVAPFVILVPFVMLQILIPMRSLLYPGDVLWTEEGFRFSWRVMLVEKVGYVTYFVYDPASNRQWTINPERFLTVQQAKQMSFQPDMILQFAHFIEDHYRQEGYGDVEVRAEAYVSFNGRASRLLIDPTFDLSAEPASLLPKDWILP